MSDRFQFDGFHPPLARSVGRLRAGLVLAAAYFVAAPAAAQPPWDIFYGNGRAAYSKGEYHEAEAALQRAVAISERFPPPDYRLALSASALGWTQWKLNKPREAHASAARAHSIFSQLDRRQFLLDTAHNHHLSGLTTARLGVWSDAERQFRVALRLYRQSPGQVAPQAEVLLSMTSAAVEQWEFASAAEFAEQARIVAETDQALAPLAATAIARKVQAETARGQYRLAERALGQWISFDEDNPEAIPPYPHRAELLRHHGALLLATGEYSDAADTFREAWERLPETAATDDRARTALGRAWAALYVGDWKDAAELAYDARPFAAGDEQLLAAINRLDGSVLFARGRIADAKPHWAKALARDRQRWGAGHPAIARSLSGEAVLLASRGDYAKAEDAASQALAAISECVGEQHPETVRLLAVLAGIAYLHGDQKVGGSERRSYDDALLFAQRGETIAASFLSEDHPLLADVADAAARAHLGLGQIDEAQLAVAKAKKIRLEKLGPDHPSLAATFLTEGMIAHFRGDLPAARELLERADELARKAAGDSSAHDGRAEPLLALSALATVHALPYTAERYYGGARSSLRTVAGDPVIAYQLSRWGSLYRGHGRRAEARWFYGKAREIYVRMSATNPRRYREHIATVDRHLRELQ